MKFWNVHVPRSTRYASLAIALTLSSGLAHAQTGMGIGTSNPLEQLEVTGAIKLGSTATTNAGTIRWNGTNFQGYNGSQWVNLDTQVGADTDWTVSGANQYSAVAGNVGVGTTSPQQKLHIEVSQNSGVSVPVLVRNVGAVNGTGTGSGIGFNNMNSSANAKTIIYNERVSDFGLGKLHFILDNTADNSVADLADSRMTILSNGNVGVGTTAPGAKLEVAGQLKITGGTPGANKVLTSDATGLATWQTPTAYNQAAFTTTSNLTSNAPGAYGSDDFVFGSPQLADNGNSAHDARFFFDKSKAAFRAGYADVTQWDDANIGLRSIAIGDRVTASGQSSVALGRVTTASGSYATTTGSATVASGNVATAFGDQTLASGDKSTAMGYQTTASGSHSTAMGNNTNAIGGQSVAMGNHTTASGAQSIATGNSTTASGNYSTATGSSTTASGNVSTAFGDQTVSSAEKSTAMGFQTTASGNYATSAGYQTAASGTATTAMGANTAAKSGYEMVVGRFNTDYTPASTTGWVATDRLFVVGNGTGSGASSSNALTIYKDGKMNINDAYDMPTADGSNAQVLTTNGSGTTTWATVADPSATNEIQALGTSGNTVTLSNGGGSVTVPYATTAGSVSCTGSVVVNMSSTNVATVTHGCGTSSANIMCINGDVNATQRYVIGVAPINANSFQVRLEAVHNGLIRFNYIITP